MLQILGAVMIILGGAGIGYLYAEREREKIAFAGKWECIMHMFLSEITYKKQPLSLACKEIGEKTGDREGEFLKKVSEQIEKRKKKNFCLVWQEEGNAYLDTRKLSKEERMLIQEFGVLTGFENENMQKKMIEEQAEKWKQIKMHKQEEYRERKRLALILSSCLGIMIVLILW